MAYAVIEVNWPPNGTCKVWPIEGVPFDTNFNFTCFDLTDDRSVAEVQFFGKCMNGWMDE